MGFEDDDDVDDAVGEVVNDGDGLARRRSDPRLSAFFTLENPGMAYENHPVNVSANLPLVVEPSAVVIAVSTPSGPTATEGIGAADAPALGRSGGGGGDEGDGRRSKQSAVLICSNPSQTLIHTPMPLPKSTRPSVTASPELIKAQTAEFAVEISISSELKRTTVLHPPQKRRRLPPNRIVSCNT
uniref:Uncharacterized protein n=1 Tax=Oryza barthii TaxID=65489 RepID=A0A0D3EWN5_9ORYZ